MFNSRNQGSFPFLENGALAVVCLVLSGFYLPWIPHFLSVTPGVDESWISVLHYLFETKKQFGTEAIFTYGPLGFITLFYYHPATYAIVFTIYAFFFLVFTESAWFVLKKSVQNFWGRLVLFVGLFSFSSPPPDNYFLTGCVIAFLAFNSVENRASAPRNYFLAVALVLISLVKFTYTLIVFPIMAALFISSLLKKQIPWIGIFFIAAYLFLWKALGQNLSNLPAYFQNSWEIASGYSFAMGSPPFPRVGFLEIYFCCASGLLLFAVAAANRPISLYAVLKNTVFLALILFLTFKGAFVLNDEYHSLIAMFFLPATSLLFFPRIYFAFGSMRWRIFSILVLVVALGAAFSGLLFYKIVPFKNLSRELSLVPSKLKVIRSKGFKEIYTRVNEQVAALAPLPNAPGSADIYSYWQAILLANGLEYAPRPVFQSYVAYTPRLAAINAQHLQKPSAANSLFLTIDPIYDRLPAHDDGASWPEIATRYTPIATTHSLLFLRKKPSPGSYRLIPVSSATIRWGETLAVPQVASGKVWAKISMRSTLLNKILNGLYKPVASQMITWSNDGSKKIFRLIPSMAEAGFLLSPLISDAASFAKTFWPVGLSVLDRQFISQIGFSLPQGFSPEMFFERDIHVSFFELETT